MMLLNPFNCLKAASNWPPLTNFDVNKTCRACLEDSIGKCGLFIINSQLKQQIFDMFGIKIDDSKKWKICISCLKSIEKASTFRDMIRTADLRLKFSLQDVHMTIKQEPGLGQSRISRSVSAEPLSDSADEVPQQNGVNHHEPTTNEDTRTETTTEESSSELSDSDDVPHYVRVTKTPRTVPCKNASCKRKFTNEMYMKMHLKSVHHNRAKQSRSSTSQEIYLKKKNQRKISSTSTSTSNQSTEPLMKRRCEICREFFDSHEKLIEHRSTHKRSSYIKEKQVQTPIIEVRKKKEPPPLKTRNSKCSYCSKKFSSYWNMVRHVKEVHKKVHKNAREKPQNKLYKCECGRRFDVHQALSIHQSRWCKMIHKKSNSTKEESDSY